MSVRVCNLRTDALIRHLKYSGAAPDLALFLERAMAEQVWTIKSLAESVRRLEARVERLETAASAKGSPLTKG